MKKCQAGCKHFTGGEVRHHKDCQYYKDSFSEMYDMLRIEVSALLEENERLKERLDYFEVTYFLELRAEVDRLTKEKSEIKEHLEWNISSILNSPYSREAQITLEVYRSLLTRIK